MSYQRQPLIALSLAELLQSETYIHTYTIGPRRLLRCLFRLPPNKAYFHLDADEKAATYQPTELHKRFIRVSMPVGHLANIRFPR